MLGQEDREADPQWEESELPGDFLQSAPAFPLS